MLASDRVRVIVGLGLTGLSCVRHCVRQGWPVRVIDTREQPPGLEQLRQEFPQVAHHFGGWNEVWLQQAQEIVVSPGIALSDPALQRAQAAGAELIGDIDWFVDARPAGTRCIGITGSNGKSTVTTLVTALLNEAGLVARMGGNIGIPALDLLEQPADVYVLELSSFQLERARPLHLDAATVLNVSPDHMDRYPSLLAYHQAKHRIFRGARVAVVNSDDPLSTPLVVDGLSLRPFTLGQPAWQGFGVAPHEGEPYLFKGRQPLLAVSSLKLFGQHNVANALAALALVDALGVALHAVLPALLRFTGLEHRCQWVADLNGVSCINDSKGTNIGATVAALEGLAGRSLVLIAGGDGKGADFAPLAKALQPVARGIVLVGKDADRIAEVLPATLPQRRAVTMLEAVSAGMELAQAGDILLLSPACASLDQYRNFEARGQAFVEAVQQLGAVDG